MDENTQINPKVTNPLRGTTDIRALPRAIAPTSSAPKPWETYTVVGLRGKALVLYVAQLYWFVRGYWPHYIYVSPYDFVEMGEYVHPNLRCLDTLSRSQAYCQGRWNEK